jgi:hypothetical protein
VIPLAPLAAADELMTYPSNPGRIMHVSDVLSPERGVILRGGAERGGSVAGRPIVEACEAGS